MNRLKLKNPITEQDGAILVEASLYFPITILMVMLVIYYGLFKMQESYFFFQVERAASELSREAAYPGYSSFTEKEDNLLKSSAVDRNWENGPDASQVQSYYQAYNGSLSKIYRWGLDDKIKTRIQAYQKALVKYSEVFSMGKTEAYVSMEQGFLTKSVKAEIRYVIPMPGILKLLTDRRQVMLYAAAYQPVINNTDFVRNVDVAWDLTNFLLKKLGVDTKGFVEKFNKIKDWIL